MTSYELPPPGGAGSPGKRWLQAAATAIAGTALLVLAFFFAVFALVAGLSVAAVLAARWWWMSRRIRGNARPGSDVLEGEYRVVDRRPEDEDGPDSRPR